MKPYLKSTETTKFANKYRFTNYIFNPIRRTPEYSNQIKGKQYLKGHIRNCYAQPLKGYQNLFWQVLLEAFSARVVDPDPQPYQSLQTRIRINVADWIRFRIISPYALVGSGSWPGSLSNPATGSGFLPQYQLVRDLDSFESYSWIPTKTTIGSGLL